MKLLNKSLSHLNLISFFINHKIHKNLIFHKFSTLNTIKNERFVLNESIDLKSILFHLLPLLYSQVRTIFSLDCTFRWLSKFKTFFHCWSSPRICTVCVSPFVQRTIGRYYRRQKRETNQRASGSGATDGPPFQIFVSTSCRVWIIMRDSSIVTNG